MRGEPDRNHLELAHENEWILVTFDDDFLALVVAEKFGHAGVIFVHQVERDIGDVVNAINAHLQERSLDDHGIHHI